MPVKEKIERFASMTSMHGTAQIILTRSPTKRCIWVVVFLGAWTMFIYNTYLVCQNYLAYPKKTDVEVVSEEVPFPDITLCNHRRLDFYSAYKDRLSNKDYMMDPDGITKENMISQEEFIQRCRSLSNFSAEFQDCNIKEVYDVPFRRCFTIISGDSKSYDAYTGRHITVLTGSGMLAEYENKDWFSSGDGVRVFFNIPGTKIIPSAETGPIDVPPGHMATLSFKARRTIRVGVPHGKCSNKYPFSISNNTTYRQIVCEITCNHIQLLNKCSCYSESVDFELPGVHCWDEYNEVNRNFRVCSYSLDGKVLNFTECGRSQKCNKKCNCSEECNARLQAKEWRCLEEVRRDQFRSEKCECYPSCDEIDYDVSLGLLKWPSEDSVEPKYREIFERKTKFNTLSLNYTERFRYRFLDGKIVGARDDGKYEFYENFVKNNHRKALADFVTIAIKVSDIKVVKSIETPLYTPSQLISEVGGQLGIWIGVSIITCFEVLDLLMAAVEDCCNKKSDKETKEDVKENDEGKKKDKETKPEMKEVDEERAKT